MKILYMPKYNNKTKKRRNKQIKGAGIFIENDEESFRMFLENSTFNFIAKGANGSIYSATLNPGITSPYKSMDPFHFNDPVNSIVVKISYIEENIDTAFDTEPLNEKNFEDEINIQTDISMKTMEYLQPICPSIVYANITNDPIYANIILAKTNASKATLRNIIYNRLRYGIIGMEFAIGYTTINKLVPNIYNIATLFSGVISPETINYISMAYYIIIELAVKAGYTHADFHPGNILIHPTDTNYFSRTPGSVVILDFGWAQKLSHKNIKKIKEFYELRQYVEILKLLCKIPRKDDYDLLDPSFKGFEYICKIPDPPEPYIDIFNRRIGELIAEKEEKTNEIITLFNSKPEGERHLYPLLPLSNSMKHKVYNGIIQKYKIVTIDTLVLNFGLTIPYIQRAFSFISLVIYQFRKFYKEYYNAHYIYVYLNSKYGSIINNQQNVILYAIVSLFYAKVFGRYSFVDVYKIALTLFLGEIPSIKQITDTVNIYYNELNDCRIITIYDFVPDILELKRGKELADELMVLDDKYTDPKKYVNRVYPKVHAPVVNSSYEFPFQSSELTPPPFRAPAPAPALAIALTPAHARVSRKLLPTLPSEQSRTQKLLPRSISLDDILHRKSQVSRKLPPLKKKTP